MIYLRSFLFLSVMIVSIPIYAPVVFVSYLFPYPRRYVIIRQWARFIIWWLKITCNINYVVHGRENLPATPAIIFSKHQSAWETIALQLIIIPPLTFVLKRELLWIPIYGWCLAALEPIALNRGAGRSALKSLIRQGKERIAQQRWIIIFPEGTRVAPGEKGRYAIGGALLAEQTAVPVIPIAHNAGNYWPRRSFVKLPGTIQVVIGPAIPTLGRSAQEINHDAEKWIEETMKNCQVSIN